MKKITICFVMAVLCLNFGSRAQDKKAVDVTLKGIQIGQQVPDVMITGLHNYKDAYGRSITSAKLSDFKGKLLILDFWATWCSPCLAMIPKMDSLQKEFGDKVVFLSVTYQSEKEVLPFLEKLEKGMGKVFSLPLVLGDKVLGGLFPHVYLPHYVWVGETGKVGAITGLDKVNRDQLMKVLSSKAFGDMGKKSDFEIDLDLGKGLFVSGNGGSDSLVRIRSVFSGFAPGLSGGNRMLDRNQGSPNHSVVLLSINQNIKNLFKRAYGAGRNIPNSRIKLAVKDTTVVTSRLAGNAYLSWLADHGFCYELSVPLAQQGLLFKKMQQDLDFNFPQYQAGYEEIEKECLVLVRTDQSIKLVAAGEKSFAKFSATGFELSNKPLRLLMESLQDYYMQNSSRPVVDESGVLGNVTFKVDANLGNLASLNAGLKGFGLALVSQKRVIPILVVRDRVNEGITVHK